MHFHLQPHAVSLKRRDAHGAGGQGCSGDGDCMWPPWRELQSLFVQLSRVRVLWCHHERQNSILSVKKKKEKTKMQGLFLKEMLTAKRDQQVISRVHWNWERSQGGRGEIPRDMS